MKIYLNIFLVIVLITLFAYEQAHAQRYQGNGGGRQPGNYGNGGRDRYYGGGGGGGNRYGGNNNLGGGSRCACPYNYQPVCGNNGRTYSNSCQLNCERKRNSYLKFQYRGECHRRHGGGGGWGNYN